MKSQSTHKMYSVSSIQIVEILYEYYRQQRVSMILSLFGHFANKGDSIPLQTAYCEVGYIHKALQ